MSTEVKISKAGPVATLTLASADGLHVITEEVLDAIRTGLDALSQDQELLALVFTAEGTRTFSAGADLRRMADLDPERARAYSYHGQGVAQAIARFPVVTIAALNAPVYGGGIELALACDFRVAAQKCIFHYQASKLGLLPGWGGTQRLPQLVGRARAKAMMLMCRPVSADEALDWGLVDDVAHGGSLDDVVRRWTDELVGLERHSVIQIKRSLDLGQGGDYAGEREAFAACFSGGRTQTAIREWLAKGRRTVSSPST
jgi:enoyl-CoA hydratase/carnithine racemase